MAEGSLGVGKGELKVVVAVEKGDGVACVEPATESVEENEMASGNLVEYASSLRVNVGLGGRRGGLCQIECVSGQN